MTVDDNSSIYVGGLSYNATEDTLRRAFDLYGPIVAVKIINDQSVGGKCYAFVTFKTPRSALRAIAEMDGRSIEGRIVRVNQVNTRPARSNFAQERPALALAHRSRSRERLHQRGAPAGLRSSSREILHGRAAPRLRSSSREIVQDYSRGRRRDLQREWSRDQDQPRDRGFTRLHDQNPTLQSLPRDHHPEMGYVEHEHDRNHEQDWQNNSKPDMETPRDHSRYQKTHNDTDERPNSADGFSHDIHGDRAHDQVERKREIASQKVEDLQQEITSMKDTVGQKKLAILKLQEKARMLEDAVTAARKVRSQRQMQLTELHKCYGQVKEYSERLKNSEQDLQNLVDSTKVGDEL